MASAARVERACIALCALIFVILSGIHTYRRTYPDTAFFGGDTWEYQSIAVNIAKGHGPRQGGIEPFEAYRFEESMSDPALKAAFLRSGAAGGHYNFWRQPGYPYFLGMIYTVAGVHPAVVKRIQALLWILVASFLPYLGLRFLGGPGFVGGLLAIPVYLQHSRGMADDILTETIIVFMLFVTTLAYLRWSRARSTASLALLGLSLGVALLVKGSLLFLPLLYLCHLLWSGRHDPFRTTLRRALVFVCSVGIVVLPYSAFASVSTGRVILLSTQGSLLFLQGNNELAVSTGACEPHGPDVPGSFFQRADIEPLPNGTKVVRFYQANPGALLEILPRKIDRGFGALVYLRLLCWALMSAAVLAVMSESRAFASRRFRAVALAAAVALVVAAALALVEVRISALLLLTALMWAPVAARRPRLRALVPVPLAACFLDFLLLTVILFGHPRIPGVIDFLVTLAAMAGTVWLGVECVRRLAWRADSVDSSRASA